MENQDFKIILTALLDQIKSKKQINEDIKKLQKTINHLKLTATFGKADTKKELNNYIKQLEGQLSTLKLKAKIDSKNVKSEINQALNNVSYKDIDLLDIDENKVKLKVKKVIADAKAYVENNQISLNIETKKEKLNNQLTTYLNRNTKIRESEVLLKEVDKIRDKISAINDQNSLSDATSSFQLFKSEVQATGYQTKSTTDKIKGMISEITKIGSLFSVASLAVNNFVKSLQTLKTNDSILTEISKTSEMTKEQLEELGDEAFSIASKYGNLSSNYLLGVQEMARSGYEDMSKELGELSLLAQGAGDMTAEMANNYILATDAAYKYSGSIEKLTSALDGANYISNKNSASLTDIADAISVSASFAANAGIAIDELTAAEATMIATTKRSGSEMGRAFRSIILNLQQVSGEFDGEIIDEEQLAKVEARCHSLGVELEYLKDGVATLRNPMEVLKELAEVYNSLPDDSAEKQGLISDLGGKYHANALSSLLSRWNIYEKMLSEYSQGAGSAMSEANKTADSWEGKLNSLQNSWDSLVNSLTDKDAIKGGISFLDGSIQAVETLVDVLGEIPVLLTTINTAVVAMNRDYGITQLVNPETKKLDIQGNLFGIDFTAIKTQKKHFEEAAKAISYWNKELKVGETDINAFNNETVKNNAQLKAYLSTCSKDAPASLSGYKTHLNAAGVATDALRLKTILLNSAISFGLGLLIQGIISGISQAVTAIDDYIHRLDIARENLASTQEELSSIDTELDNVNKQIDEILAKDKIEIVDENELKKLRDEVGLLKEKKALLEAQKYEQQQETNKYISEQYGKYFTTAVVARPDGSIEEVDALSYFKEIYDQANAYVSSQSPLLEEDKLNFESIKEGAVDLGNQLADLLEDFKPITAEEEKQKEAMEAMLDYAVKIADMYAGTSYEIGERLVEKFASGDDVNSNKLISDWIDSLNDEDKRIMVQCELEEPTLDDLQKYLSDKKVEVGVEIETDGTSLSDIFSLEDSENTETNLGRISESIDTIQNAYKTLNDAIDEYNQSGSFSIDTIQSVIALGDDWLDYLVDEEGHLKLDKESLEQLTLSRLNDMRVQTINNLIDNVSKIQTDADANEYLASTNYALAESYEEVAQASLKSAYSKLQDAVAAETLSKSNMDRIMSKAQTDIDKINKLFTNADLSLPSITGSSSGSSSSAKSTQKEYEELFDFFERRIDVLNDSLETLEADLENVTGSFAKNHLLSAQSSIYQEEINNYTDVLAMYQKKADEVLSTLPDDIAGKIKNGAVDLTTFVGESSEAVVEAMKDYENWSGKIAECTQQIAELKETLRDLELQKFNNIVQDYTDQFDIRENGISLIDKQIALLEEAGQLIGNSFYAAQKSQAEKQLEILEAEKAKLAEQMTESIGSGRVQKGTDEWLEMVNAIAQTDSSILDCKKSIEEFDNALLELNWQVFERIQDTFSNFGSELENLAGLFDDIDVADDATGSWTTDALANLGVLAQQYELSQYQVEQYNKAITELKQKYLDGKYSATEYADRLAELSQAQWDSVNSAESAKDAVMDLNEARVDEIVEGIEKETEAYKELTDAQIEALRAAKNLHDYQKSIEEQTKTITGLERQIAAMQNDNTAATVAKRKQLEEQLAEERAKLEELEYDHSMETQEDTLNKQYEDFEQAQNEKIEALQASLEHQELLISQSFDAVKQNAELVGRQISQAAQAHGVYVSDALTSSWKQGENAIASYGSVLSSQTSAFIGNIMGVENEVWNLQMRANETSNMLAWMFSTQSDNLVNELAQSYYAEGNLYNMTNALQSSLVNTLERGYNVSSITSALKNIESAANSAVSAIRSLNSLNTEQWTIRYNTNGQEMKTFGSEAEALAWAEDYGYDIRRTEGNNIYVVQGKDDFYKYASGTRNSKGSVIITDENGYELKLPKLDSGNYTIANEGSQVLTKAQTDNIFDWSKINPSLFKFNVPDLNLDASLPRMERRNSQPVYIENKTIFTGAVNNADNFAKEIAKIADKQITKSWKEFADNVRY